VESSVESTILSDGLNTDSLAGRCSALEALRLIERLGAVDVKINFALDLGVLGLGECLSSLEALGAWLGESALSAAVAALGSWAWVLLRAAGVFPGGAAAFPWTASGATVLSRARPGAASSPSSQVGSWAKSAATASEATTAPWSGSAAGARWFMAAAMFFGGARVLGVRVWAGALLGAAGVVGAVVAAASFAWLSAAATVMAGFAFLYSSIESTSTIEVISN
jgi:hypothetical protein